MWMEAHFPVELRNLIRWDVSCVISPLQSSENGYKFIMWKDIITFEGFSFERYVPQISSGFFPTHIWTIRSCPCINFGCNRCHIVRAFCFNWAWFSKSPFSSYHFTMWTVNRIFFNFTISHSVCEDHLSKMWACCWVSLLEIWFLENILYKSTELALDLQYYFAPHGMLF